MADDEDNSPEVNSDAAATGDDVANVVLKERVVKVNPRVAKRRQWKKFNDVANETPGVPNPANTILKEEVSIQFVLSDNLDQQEGEAGLPGMGRMGEAQVLRDTSVHCRTCGGPHLTHTCPYKAQLESLNKKMAAADETVDNSELNEMASRQQRPGAYVPLGMRDAMQSDRRKLDDDSTVRVNNLSENTSEEDLRDLFGRFGTIKRVFLARDKHTKVVRGFAYVTFDTKIEATNAIHGINGFGFDHLILKVDWAKSDKR